MSERGAPPRPRLGRCLAVWAAATGSAGLLVTWLLPDPGRVSSPGAGFVGALLLGCELLAVAGAGWLWFLVTLVVRDALRGREARGWLVPAALRRVVLAGCGLTLASGLLVPSAAQADDPHRPTADLLDGLSIPDRMPTTRWVRRVRAEVRRGGTAEAPPARSAGRQVVVAPGDTLWAIAARTLPPGAGAAAVDRRWREIYRTNRATVGPDPHLILPGQRLALPHPTESPEH